MPKSKLSKHLRALSWTTFHSALIVISLLGIVLYFENGDQTTLKFALVGSFAIFSILWAVFLKPRLSAALSLLIVVGIIFVSNTKFSYTSFHLHALDAFFYGLTFDSFKYLGSEFTRPVVLLGLLTLFSIVLVTALYHHESKWPSKRFPILVGGIAAIMTAVMLAPSASPVGITIHQMHPAHPVSAAFLSLADVARFFRQGTIIDRMAVKPQQVSALPPSEPCTHDGSYPDIITVLSESAVPPNKFDHWKYDPRVLETFKSHDSAIHGLKVETFGGATWVSEFQFLTGLSSEAFEWMRFYVTTFMEGRIRHSLPQRLAACGYRTIYVTTGPLNFVNEGPFMRSLGFEEVYDAVALGLAYHERDKQHYEAAFKLIDCSHNKDHRPIFLFTLTSAAHAPYNYRFLPNIKAQGEPYGNDAESEEYMRRLHIARADLQEFRKALEAGRKHRPALLVEFGDHHPSITLPFVTEVGSGDFFSQLGSKAFETHYAIWPIGFSAYAPIPATQQLDLAYLGLTVLEVAGIPLGPAYSAQRELREKCQGLFYTCNDRPAVDRYLAQMDRSGLINLP
jgi:phosphoglycerol transferase MdoB-like AlkP superfamily enzyme